MVDLLCVYSDGLSRHLSLDYDLVCLVVNLLLGQWGEGDLSLAIVRVPNQEHEIDQEWVVRIKLSNPVDGDLGDMEVHHKIDAVVFIWCDDLLVACLALLVSLSQ